MISRDEFLQPASVTLAQCTLLDGRKVTVRCAMSELDFSDYQATPWKQTKDGNLVMDQALLARQRRKLVYFQLCDSDGQRLLQEGDVDGSLRRVDGPMLADLAAQIRVLCGIDKREEDPAKNSASTSG